MGPVLNNGKNNRRGLKGSVLFPMILRRWLCSLCCMNSDTESHPSVSSTQGVSDKSSTNVEDDGPNSKRLRTHPLVHPECCDLKKEDVRFLINCFFIIELLLEKLCILRRAT
mmetsp:Transcript_27240/g.66270  ORF Transcript_27240/g.66270 Transcript_27240/m.66270 type:complete len:112 (-) Transcript_27240:1388-1723(-)